MVYLTVIFGLYVIASVGIIMLLIVRLLDSQAAAQKERKDLQDRILALTAPEAMVTKTAVSHLEELRDNGELKGNVQYVDDKRELELAKESDRA